LLLAAGACQRAGEAGCAQGDWARRVGDPRTVAALAALSDDFAGDALAPSWTVVHGDLFRPAVGEGTLRMTTTAFSVWYMADRGPALVKSVTGGFKVSATVRARQASDPRLPPPPEFQFAGLIARDPASEESRRENYVFTVLGERGGYLTNETKTTRDNVSQVHGPNEGRATADGQLRICRVGQVFRVYNRPLEGGAWKLEQTYDRRRNPLPATLQVGPIVYSFTKKPDLVGQFDDIRFAYAGHPDDCAKD
jgi:hypothetical protein